MVHQEAFGAVEERVFGGDGRELALREVSRFGVWRARVKLVAAVALGRAAVRPLHHANPMKVFALSTLDLFDEATAGLPGRGVLPINDDAPLMRLAEALWLIALTLVAVYVGLRLVGHHPLRSATGHSLSFWLTAGHRLL